METNRWSTGGKLRKSTIFDDKRVVLLVSVLLALLSWMIVAGFIQPGESKLIENIPIDYTRDEASYRENNLVIVSEITDAYANAYVEGNNQVISQLGTWDISVYADYRSVNEAGTYNVPLYSESLSSGSFEITNFGVGDDFRRYVTLEFDEITTKVLPIEPVADGVTVTEEGYFRDATPQIDHAEVEIEGVRGLLNRIVRVAAVVDDVVETTTTQTFDNVPLRFYDSDGVEIEVDISGDIDRNTINTSVGTTKVTVPVLRNGVLNLNIEIAGTPESMDMEWLQSLITLSPASVNVAGRDEVIENLPKAFTIQTLDISDLVQGEQVIELALPTGLRNRDNVESVTVFFDTSTLERRTIEAGSHSVINVPQNLELEVIDERLPTVTLMGDAEQISTILPEHIILQIDAYGKSAASNVEVPARVLIFRNDRVFSIGTYNIMCRITEVDQNEGG